MGCAARAAPHGPHARRNAKVIRLGVMTTVATRAHALFGQRAVRLRPVGPGAARHRVPKKLPLPLSLWSISLHRSVWSKLEEAALEQAQARGRPAAAAM